MVGARYLPLLAEGNAPCVTNFQQIQTPRISAPPAFWGSPNAQSNDSRIHATIWAGRKNVIRCRRRPTPALGLLQLASNILLNRLFAPVAMLLRALAS